MLTPKPKLSFNGLLASLLLLLILPGIVSPYSGEALGFLFMLVVFASLYLVANDKQHLTIGLMLVVPVIITHWSFGLIHELVRVSVNAGIQIVFLLYVCAQIYDYLFRARVVESNVIYAALCLYILLGVVWALAYFLLELNLPGSIALKTEIDHSALNSRELMAEIFYFSFVTITTLGYGDIAPVSLLARSLTIVQALVGQVYIAIVIARLVSLQIAGEINRSSGSDSKRD